MGVAPVQTNITRCYNQWTDLYLQSTQSTVSREPTVYTVHCVPGTYSLRSPLCPRNLQSTQSTVSREPTVYMHDSQTDSTPIIELKDQNSGAKKSWRERDQQPVT